jgi:uncharacterized protein YecT (DUF1311 family)
MTQIKFLITLLICLGSNILFAQTQLEMDQQEIESYENTNKELDEIYKQILIEYKTDTVFIANLKASQKIWVTFRDAELEVKFPDGENRHYGSVNQLCVAHYLEKLTRDRINTLNTWLVGYIDKDACNGSVKWIDNKQINY